jgi:hypothetical protein
VNVIHVCALQQACKSAPLQLLLQSAAMSVMRRTARTGANERTSLKSAMNWKSVTNGPDGRFEAGGFNSGFTAASAMPRA